MLQYTNGFKGLSNDEKENIILKFVQSEPLIANDDEDLSIEQHEIVSLIMDYDCAIELVKFLVGTLADKIDINNIVEDEEDE